MRKLDLRALIGFAILALGIFFFRSDQGSLVGLIAVTLIVALFWYLNGLNFAVSSLRNMLMLAAFFGVVLLGAQFLFPSDEDSAKMGQLEGTDLNPAQIARLKSSREIAMQLYLDHKPTPDERYFKVGQLPWTHDGFHYQQAKVNLDPSLSPEAASWVDQHLPPGDIERDIRAIESWYRTSFAYSLTPGALHSDHPLDEFLFETHRGFCEHYAASVATLMKLRGHRAQVVVGYAGGSWNSVMQRLTYLESDAHAWVEVADPVTHQWRIVDPTEWVASETGSTLPIEWVSYAGYAAFIILFLSAAVIFVTRSQADGLEALLKKIDRLEGRNALPSEGLTISDRLSRLAAIYPERAAQMSVSLSLYLTNYFAANPSKLGNRQLIRSLSKW